MLAAVRCAKFNALSLRINLLNNLKDVFGQFASASIALRAQLLSYYKTASMPSTMPYIGGMSMEKRIYLLNNV